MKCFYNIKIQTQTRTDEETGKSIVELVNKKSFSLKTTGFNTILSDIYVNLGSLESGVAIGITKAEMAYVMPPVRLSQNLNDNMAVEFSIEGDCKIEILYPLGYWDPSLLSELDELTVGEMDKKEG